VQYNLAALLAMLAAGILTMSLVLTLVAGMVFGVWTQRRRGRDGDA
jgi:hypothetical protein